MSAFRIVVVDDSALFRTMLRNIVTEIPGCEVVASVSDGQTAVEKIAELKPDLVTLDVEMPGLSGIDVLRMLKHQRIHAKVIMISRLTASGAQVTTDALIEGAFDFILKPSSGNPIENKAVLKSALEDRIKALRETTSTADPGRSEKSVVPTITRTSPIEVVVIGCSTGGPDALAQVIPDLPADLPVPVIVVQHMPERFTASLAARLDEATELDVVEAAEGAAIRPGQIVIAKGGKHLELESIGTNGVRIHLSEDALENGCRPAVDFTLRSAVQSYRGNVLAVILTGMGRDGASGCGVVRSHGGRVIAQHAEGCTVYGMPKAVVQAGVADELVKLPSVAKAIVRMLKR